MCIYCWLYCWLNYWLCYWLYHWETLGPKVPQHTVCLLPSVVHRVFAEVGWGSSHEIEAGGCRGGGGGSMGSGGREGIYAEDDTGNVRPNAALVRPNAALSTQDLEDSEMAMDTSDIDGREDEQPWSPSSTGGGSSLRKRMLNCSVFSGVESSRSSKFSRTSSGGASVSSGEGGMDGEVAGRQRRPRSRERGPGRAPQGRKVTSRPPPTPPPPTHTSPESRRSRACSAGPQGLACVGGGGGGGASV